MVESQSDAPGSVRGAALHRPPRRRALRTASCARPSPPEESVYGVILVSGMIVVAGGHGESSWTVFWTVLITVIVFWAAHVYAGTVARHGLDHDRMIGLARRSASRSAGHSGSSPRHSSRRSSCSRRHRAIPDAYAIWTALWVGVVVLAVLGWIAFSAADRRGRSASPAHSAPRRSASR